MEIRGLKKGSNDLRKFTFNDEEYIQKDGKFYYKVNYGKNALEGEYAEDEIGYVEVTQVIPLGGKKPKPIPELQQATVAVTPQVEQPVEKPKRGRPPKVNKLEQSQETVQVAPQEGTPKFEYHVDSLKVESAEKLKEILNSWGELGWELCWVEHQSIQLIGGPTLYCIFKRKRG